MKSEESSLAFQVRIISEQYHESELVLLVHGINILEYVYKDETKRRTIIGNIDDLMAYLESTIQFTDSDIPFPYHVLGDNASELDKEARKYDTDDMDEFDKYYDTLDEWTYPHSWIHAGNGYFIPDVMFRKVDTDIEISWNNENLYDDAKFTSLTGCVRIPCEQYITIIQNTIETYRRLWNKS